MAEAQFALTALLSAEDRMTRQLEKAEKASDRLGKKIDTMGRRFTRAGREVERVTFNMAKGLENVALVGGAGIALAATRAGQFEKAIRSAGVFTQATAGEMRKLRQAALGGARGLATTPVAAAEAAVSLGRLGLTAEQVAGALTPALQLVVGSFGELSADRAGKLVGQGLKIFNLEAEQASVVAQQMATVVGASAADFKKLNLAFGIAAPSARKLGADLAETSALIGLMADVLPARMERGATSIARLFEELAIQSNRTRVEQTLGIKILNEQGDGFKDTTTIIEGMIGALIKMDNVQRTRTLTSLNLSIQATRGLDALVERLRSGTVGLNKAFVQGEGAFRNFVERIRNENIVLEDLTNTFITTLPGAMQEFQRAADRTLIAIGSTIEDKLVGALDAATGFLDSLAEKMENMGPAGKNATAGIMGVVGGIALLGLAGRALQFILGTRVGGLALFGRLFGIGAGGAAAAGVGGGLARGGAAAGAGAVGARAVAGAAGRGAVLDLAGTPLAGKVFTKAGGGARAVTRLSGGLGGAAAGTAAKGGRGLFGRLFAPIALFMAVDELAKVTNGFGLLDSFPGTFEALGQILGTGQDVEGLARADARERREAVNDQLEEVREQIGGLRDRGLRRLLPLGVDPMIAAEAIASNPQLLGEGEFMTGRHGTRFQLPIRGGTELSQAFGQRTGFFVPEDAGIIIELEGRDLARARKRIDARESKRRLQADIQD